MAHTARTRKLLIDRPRNGRSASGDVVADIAPGYQRRWLRSDVLAGTTLAAVAIPKTMGYTSIAQTPVVTGLYTIIFPAIVFGLLGLFGRHQRGQSPRLPANPPHRVHAGVC
jgi:Sulfate permease family